MTLNAVMAVTLPFSPNSVGFGADYVKVVEDTPGIHRVAYIRLFWVFANAYVHQFSSLSYLYISWTKMQVTEVVDAEN